ncbi:MAG: MFS transporter [Candidatus Dormibacteria bacterium]
MSAAVRARMSVALVALAFFVVMMGTTLPTPLYPTYQSRFGFSQLTITVIFAVYAVTVVLSLMLIGRLSDFIGRRRVLLPGVVFSAASAALFLVAGGLGALLAGRVLSGVSAAIFTGTATAALVDLWPQQRSRATIIAVAANLGGLGSGQLLSGLVADHVTKPLEAPFVVDLVLCGLACVALVLAGRDAAQRRGRWRPQRFRVPPEVRRQFVPAAVAGFCGFAVFGVYGSVVPGFLAHVLHVAGATAIGLITWALLIAAALGQLITRRMAPTVALSLGCGALLGGTCLTALAVALTNIVPLIAATIVIGVGQGMVIGAGLASINEHVAVQERGEVASNYFVLLYIGLALPVVGVGVAADAIGLRAAALIFSGAVVVIVGGVLATLLMRASHERVQVA